MTEQSDIAYLPALTMIDGHLRRNGAMTDDREAAIRTLQHAVIEIGQRSIDPKAAVPDRLKSTVKEVLPGGRIRWQFPEPWKNR